jgi:hypothetical protein
MKMCGMGFLPVSAYDADGFIPALTIRRIERVTPPKTNRKGRRDATSPSTPNAIFSSVSSMLSNNSEAFQLITLITKRSLGNFFAGVHLACSLLGLNEDTP